VKLEHAQQRSLLESIVIDGSLLAGLGLVTYGAWLIFPPAGFVVAGVLLLAFGVFMGARE
jgi:hypothetical protein